MKKKRITRKERREKLEKLKLGWELARLVTAFLVHWHIDQNFRCICLEG